MQPMAQPSFSVASVAGWQAARSPVHQHIPYIQHIQGRAGHSEHSMHPEHKHTPSQEQSIKRKAPELLLLRHKVQARQPGLGGLRELLALARSLLLRPAHLGLLSRCGVPASVQACIP